MARARRLYSSPLSAAAGVVQLDDEARRHGHVLRLQPGDSLVLFDANGSEADARVVTIDKRALVCSVEPRRSVAPKAARLCLIVCAPKAAKLETIVRMATELGVHAIHLAESERSVPRMSADSPKLERLRRISLEACAQSEQPFAPELAGPLPLSAAAAAAPTRAQKLVFWEGAHSPLMAALTGNEVWAIVGPEGGISANEVDVLTQLGYAPIGLGSGILRVETACVVVSALLLDRLAMLR
ncbi:MAG TPA: 16S rRNA (uracil(1498)-N(3))-methyltransferase [Polyangiales bacterium]|nr:16S rRNA (uracil(1498)-N(3))-methyltransferase [Polyangiales bacterium]